MDLHHVHLDKLIGTDNGIMYGPLRGCKSSFLKDGDDELPKAMSFIGNIVSL